MLDRSGFEIAGQAGNAGACPTLFWNKRRRQRPWSGSCLAGCQALLVLRCIWMLLPLRAGGTAPQPPLPARLLTMSFAIRLGARVPGRAVAAGGAAVEAAC